jgi:flagellar protein FlaG
MQVQATMLSAMLPRTPESGTAPAAGSNNTSTAAAVQAPAQQAAAQVQQVQAPEKSSEDFEETLAGAKKAVEEAGAKLEFSIDQDSGKTIVKVMDSATNEVIRQIPSEELVTLAKNMTKMEGMLISQKA